MVLKNDIVTQGWLYAAWRKMGWTISVLAGFVTKCLQETKKTTKEEVHSYDGRIVKKKKPKKEVEK